LGKRRNAGGAPALPGKHNAMTIQSLTIQGYRTLKDVTWTPGRLNVLIGPNGSGKSNLLKALRLLKSCAEGRLQKTLIDEGGISDVLWDGMAKELAFSMLFLAKDEFPLDLDDDTVEFEYNVIINELSTIKIETLIHIGNSAHIELISRTRNILAADTKGKLIDASRSADRGEPFLSQAGPGLSWRISLAKDGINWLLYFGFDTRPIAEVRRSAVARPEKILSEDGGNLTPVLHTLYTTDRTFKRSLDAAMKAAFGPDFDELVFPPASDQRVQLRVRWHSLKTEQSMANLSDGTIRFLCLAAILLNPKPPPLIAIDEPETGLHPSMFNVIADMAAEAATRTQVLLTTHSPQFLDAVGRHHPTTTVTGWEDGATTLSVLDPEELATWLQTYTLGELFTSGDLEAMK